MNEESTTTDYELRDDAGNSVCFCGDGWACSRMRNLDEARKHLKTGLKLYRRTVSESIEEIQ